MLIIYAKDMRISECWIRLLVNLLKGAILFPICFL